MAESPNSTLRLSENAQKSLVSYVRYACEENKKRTDMYNKMAFIDMAYARYQYENDGEPGKDNSGAADVPCGSLKDIIAPIVVSQVDTMVGYLADVYCSGYPMFPVASSPANRKEASQLQAIIDTHAVLGGYQRQCVKFFRDCMKYNFGGIEVDWAPIDKYTVLDDFLKPSDPSQVKKVQDHYNRLTRRDPYNLILDSRVEDMADVSLHGEFAGYVEIISRVELIRELQYLKQLGTGYNTTQALHSAIGERSSMPLPAFSGAYYREKPQISDIVTARSFRNFYDFDWMSWMQNKPQRQERRPVKGMYEAVTLYARIIPEEHGIYVQNRTIPQIWKLKVINNDKLICAQRIISVYDLLPILIGQPFEDGFAEQTQSLGEMQIPYQETISKLINIRIHAARRAVSDRGIYDSTMIEESDINNPHAAAKIPIKPNSKLGGKTLADAYYQIPFNWQGTEGVIPDAELMERLSGKLSGINRPQQGEFQRGNKSVREWQDTMSGSDNRLRLPAMCLEYQVFGPLKEQLKLNIFQHGPTGIFQDMKHGEPIEVSAADIISLRKKILFFKVADGYIPISKLASTQAISDGMTLIGNSPILQQAFGPRLPEMWSHLMQLSGVLDLEEYTPEAAEAGRNIAQGGPEPGTNGTGTQGESSGTV